jgi:hypothetical protein
MGKKRAGTPERLRVFVSYSHAPSQKRWLDAVVRALDAVPGVEALVDCRSMRFGERWKRRIALMIGQAHGAVFLLSPPALKSPWVRYEAGGIDPEARRSDRFLLLPAHLGIVPADLNEAPWNTYRLAGIAEKHAVAPKRPAELEAAVRAAVQEWAKDRAEILGRRLPFLQQLPRMGGPGLFGRDKELRLLDDAWADPKTRVLTFRASGGVGKSALIRTWLARLQDKDWLGAERVYGWSFYSQGTTDKNVSADPFFQHALAYFGDPEPGKGSPAAKGERLAGLILRRPTLLVLDGLEPLQFPPGENEGVLKDKGLASLLNGLARSAGRGLCVVTTRVKLTELGDLNATAAPEHALDVLSDEAGRELLRSLGTKGKDGELEETARRFGGHALALVLLGNFLKQAFKGEIKFVERVDQLIFDQKQGGHARRVMESYVKWFARNGRKPEVEVLHLMGLFDRPAEGAAVEALRDTAIRGLTDTLHRLPDVRWTQTLENLRDAGLLSPLNEAEPDALDAHPLVREHFGAKLAERKPAAWRAGHARLYRYFSAGDERPSEARGMERLYCAVGHGCAAGEYVDAFSNILEKRVWRMDRSVGEQLFATRHLGLFGADFVALSQFFERAPGQPIDWRRPLLIGRAGQVSVLTECAVRLRHLGRLSEAMRCCEEVVRQTTGGGHYADGDGKAAYAAAQLSELELISGRIVDAKRSADLAIQFADVAKRSYFRMHARTSKADVCMQLGQASDASVLFAQAQAIEDSDTPFMYSQSGYRFGCFLLDAGREDELIRIAAETPDWGVRKQGSQLSVAIDHISLGAALLRRDTRSGGGPSPQTGEVLGKAVLALKEYGYADYLIRGLVCRARYFLHCGQADDLVRARADLDEATREAERGEMRLLGVDVDIERCRLLDREGRRVQAKALVGRVRVAAKAMDYHRRDQEIAALERSLA